MKILSLDGGGSWALLQARCLLDLYGDLNGNELLKKFDLVISNSGGSMVLACLIEDMKVSEIVNWFLNEKIRESIFSKLTISQRTPLENAARLWHFGPKYSTPDKLRGLREHLPARGDKYLSELPVLIGKPSLQIVISSFDYQRNREVFFRSNMKSLADSHYYGITHGIPSGKFSDVTLAEAVHGSSNAPVNYFNKPALVRYKGDSFDRQFWDGAVGGYNNPVFAGVVEAIANGHKVPDLKILSIGTGSNLLPLYEDQNPKPDVNKFLYQNDICAFPNDIKKMATAILADPPDSASFHAYTVLHPNLPQTSTQFFRFSPLVKPFFDKASKTWKVPQPFTAKEFEQLINLDMDAVKQIEVQLITKLCDAWMNVNGEIDNQAIRCNYMLEPLIGYGKYSIAKTAFDEHF